MRAGWASARRLALGHLVGTNMLRAYMHGFFVDQRLYNKAKALTQPFDYDNYRTERINKKLEEERKTRINVRRLCSLRGIAPSPIPVAPPVGRFSTAVASVKRQRRRECVDATASNRSGPEAPRPADTNRRERTAGMEGRWSASYRR